MRLFPAHLREAKDMARALFEQFKRKDLPLNWQDPESESPTLQQTQELMAKAMGYCSWGELARLVQLPHEPRYCEDDGKAMQKLAACRTISPFMG